MMFLSAIAHANEGKDYFFTIELASPLRSGLIP